MVLEQKVKTFSRTQIHRISKKAAKILIDRCGGIDGAAAACRIGRSALADAANINSARRYLPIDALLALENSVGQPVATRFLAHEQGYVIFPIPSAPPESVWQKHLNRTVRKASRLFKHIIEALQDDEITVTEAKDLIEQTDTVLAAIGSLRGSLVARATKKQVKQSLRQAS